MQVYVSGKVQMVNVCVWSKVHLVLRISAVVFIHRTIILLPWEIIEEYYRYTMYPQAKHWKYRYRLHWERQSLFCMSRIVWLNAMVVRCVWHSMTLGRFYGQGTIEEICLLLYSIWQRANCIIANGKTRLILFCILIWYTVEFSQMVMVQWPVFPFVSVLHVMDVKDISSQMSFLTSS